MIKGTILSLTLAAGFFLILTHTSAAYSAVMAPSLAKVGTHSLVQETRDWEYCYWK
jgi:hypothetical protein